MPDVLKGYLLPETPYLTGVALVLALVLLQLRPDERRTYLNTLWFFAIGVLGQAASGAMASLSYARAAEVVTAVFTVVVSISIIRLCGFALFRLLLPLVRLRTPRIVEDLVITGAYVVFGLVHMRTVGLDLGGILATSALITAVLAFAMQDTLGNVLGGLALQLDNSIEVGDWVRVDDVSGRVTDIRWRSTSIETRNWETVVVPNSLLMKSKFYVLGKREGAPLQWRRWIPFVAEPGVPPARVIASAESAIQEAEIAGVAPAPLPNCVLLGFENGQQRFALRYYLTNIAQDDPTDSQVRVHLFNAFQRVGIRIAEPQQTIHLVEEDEAHAEAARKREIQRRLHATSGVDLFGTLTEEERSAVAERLQYAPFARGDVLTRQGNTSHWLYILASGEAEIIHELPDGSRKSLGTVSAGQFFGEMGMLTGAPRTATVIARSDVECFRLDKSAFKDLLLMRPQIAEEVSRVVTSRKLDLDQADEAALRNATAAHASHNELLGKIRKFFGLGTR